jgi:hypothetical protein
MLTQNGLSGAKSAVNLGITQLQGILVAIL